MKPRLLLALLIIAASGSEIALAQSISVRSEQIWIPIKVPSMLGGELSLKLEATLYKPEGDGPFPVVIINHGSTARVFPERNTERPDWLARIFAEHGFAAVAPMRRGRGASEGLYAESYECDAALLRHGLQNAIADLDATFAHIESIPFLDLRTVVMSGISRGGILSIAYAAERPGRVNGVVNFVGGWMGSVCKIPFNEDVFRDAATKYKTSTLWLYAQNDSFYVEGTPEKFVGAYRAAGGAATFHLYPGTFAKNGHSLAGFPAVWRADFDKYMEEAKLTQKRAK